MTKRAWRVVAALGVAAVAASAGVWALRPSAPITWALLYEHAYTPDGGRLIGFGRNGLTVVDAETHAQVWAVPPEGTGFSVIAVTPDGKHVIQAGSVYERLSNGIKEQHPYQKIRDARTGAVVRESDEQGQDVRVLAVSPDSRWFVTGSSGEVIGPGPAKNLSLWSTATGKLLATAATHQCADGTQGYVKPRMIHCVAVSPDGRFVYSGGQDAVIRVWECIAEGKNGDAGEPAVGLKEVGQFAGLKGVVVRRLAFTPDGKTLISVDGDGGGVVWSVATRKPIAEFTAKDAQWNFPIGLAVAPDGQTFVTADYAHAIVRDTATAAEVWRVPSTVVRPHSVAYSPDGRYLAISDGQHFEQWDIAAKALRPVKK